jgi:hypothetical protein
MSQFMLIFVVYVIWAEGGRGGKSAYTESCCAEVLRCFATSKAANGWENAMALGKYEGLIRVEAG